MGPGTSSVVLWVAMNFGLDHNLVLFATPSSSPSSSTS